MHGVRPGESKVKESLGARISAFLMRVAVTLWYLVALASSGHGQTLSYVYDEPGRVVGVINPSGNTAVYSYDSVGNILSISQYASSSLSVIYFTPRTGSVATTVTIYGTGFSTTPSQDSVKFNGTTATVTSATATQLVTSVPSAATSGPISVTVSGNTKTSTRSFTVGASQAPAISSITPNVASPGGTVNVAGTNFQATLANNTSIVNLTPAIITSGNAGTLGVKVPSTGSGRITVKTPYGTAVSSGDLFIPPSPYTPASVAGTGRIPFGGPGTNSAGSDSVGAGQTDLFVFDGVLGQKISATFTGDTYPSCGDSFAYLLDVHGSQLGTANLNCLSGSPDGFLSETTFPANGTYTLQVTSRSGGTGNFTLYNVVDLTTPVTLGGSSGITTNTPGQGAYWTFTLSQATRISVYSTSNPVGCVFSVLYDSRGNPVSNSIPEWDCRDYPWAYIDAFTLQPGSYSIYINTGAIPISFSTTLNNATDVTGSVTINGKAKTFTTTTMGQNIAVTFSGSANQLATVHITGANQCTIARYNLTLYSTDGTTVLTSASYIGTSSYNLPQVTLPSTGTYKIYIDPNLLYTCGATVTVTSP